ESGCCVQRMPGTTSGVAGSADVPTPSCAADSHWRRFEQVSPFLQSLSLLHSNTQEPWKQCKSSAQSTSMRHADFESISIVASGSPASSTAPPSAFDPCSVSGPASDSAPASAPPSPLWLPLSSSSPHATASSSKLASNEART